MNADFKKKYGPWALIVGGSEGLGYAFAAQCASEGVNVAICARREEKLRKAALQLEQEYKVSTRYFTCDIAKEDGGEEIIANIEDLDIGLYVYNAAIEPGGYYINLPLEDHLKSITANCVTSTKVTYYIARKMAKRGSGSIGIVSSQAGEGGMAFYIAYSAPKGFEINLGEGLWYEMRKYGVDAAVYVVGATSTPNYNEVQKLTGNNLTANSKVKNGNAPISPEEAAKNLLSQIGTGPRLYANPKDKRLSTIARFLPRKKAVESFSQTAESYYGKSFNDTVGL